MTVSALPPWIANVPLKTVGVLCAVHIFGKNIETRQIVLAGKRYFHNAAENVVNYVLNPFLPSPERIQAAGSPESRDNAAAVALQNIRDCFNYIFQIQVEYFKILNKLMPHRFKSAKSGRELNLNQFAAKGPTLINSEKRYLILSRIDGAQPYDLDLDWEADFDWTDDALRDSFRDRLALAQAAYGRTLRLGEWYAGREKNLILPLKTIMDDLSLYFGDLGKAAYHIARRRQRDRRERIRENLMAARRRLEGFALDMMRTAIFSVVKHDLDKLGEAATRKVVAIRAEDEILAEDGAFAARRESYAELLRELFGAIGYAPEEVRSQK